MNEMKKYYLEDGGVITANSATEFVKNLRDSSKFDFDTTVDGYMMNFAKRYKLWSGIDLKTDSHETFLKSLIESKFITKIEDL